MRQNLLLACALISVGCAKERDPAPTEMVDLVRFLFQHWEDPDALPEAIDNLAVWLDDNVDTDQAEDGFRLDPLAPSDVSSVDHPDQPLEELLGATGAARSEFPLIDHAGHIVLVDQTWSNPSQYKRYERDVTEGNADRFADGEGLVRTLNDVETSTLGVSIPYMLHKDYRWVAGESTEAILARSWIEDVYCNDGGGNCLEQSYSIDLFFADGANKAQRMTATWSEVNSSISLPDDTLIASLAMGIQNVFRATEEFLAGDGT